MLTDKSSTFFKGRNINTIMLELNPKTFAPHSQKHFPCRIKKLQEKCFSKKDRTIKLLQSLELLQDAKNQTSFTHSVKSSDLNQHKMSSYLAYKRQQKTLRAAHNFKLLHLKSKGFESKPFVKVNESLSPCDSPRLDVKISDSKFNLIVLDLHENEDEYCKSIAKSRLLYIKTSEGKRRKLNTADYENKLRRKFKEEGKSFQRSNEYSQSTILTFSQPHQTLKHESCKMMRGRFNIKTKTSSPARLNLNKPLQFRPWTSKKSQRGHQ